MQTAQRAQGRNRPPGLPASDLFRVIGGLRKDPLRFFTGLREQFGDVARFQIGPWVTYLVSHPDAIRHVLIDNASNYTKLTRDYQKLKLSLGEGLLTSEGDFWRRQRRIAQPAFHKQSIERFAGTMLRLTEQMLTRWDAMHGALDLAHEMMLVTLEIVSSTLVSIEVDSAIEQIGDAVSRINHRTIERITSVPNVPMWVPTRANLDLRRAIERLRALVQAQITARRGAAPQQDLLGMLLSARDPETGEGMSDTQLRDEVITMIAAGHETTANALAWTFYLLSQHPEIEARVRGEVGSVLGGRSITLADLPRLPYVKQVFQESMRLYPPAWIIGRLVVEDDVIGGFDVERGADINMSSWVTHRHPALWPDPLRFDPDRFAEGKEIPRFAYFPFGGGARQCIGTAFAMMEGQIILATVLARYSLALQPGHEVATEPLITLRPRGGLPMIPKRHD